MCYWVSVTDDQSVADGGTTTESQDAQHQTTRETNPRGANAPARQGGSVSEHLSRPDVKAQIKYVVGLFAIVGLGFGLTGFAFTDVLIPGLSEGDGGSASTGASAIVVLMLLLLTTLSGPILGLITSLRIANEVEDTAAFVTSAVGNAIGYVAMMLVTVLILIATVTTGSDTTGTSSNSMLDLGDLLIPIIVLSIPVAIVGVTTVWLHRKMMDSPQ